MNSKIYLLALAPLAFSSLFAQTTWTNGDGDFSIGNSLNWDNGLPTQTELGTINNGNTVEMTDRHQLDNKLYLVTNGSTIHVDSTVNGFRWDGGTVTLTGGNLVSEITALSTIGRDSDPIATILNINDGSSVSFAGGLTVGRLSEGLVNQSGNSSLTVAGTLRLQENSSGAISNNVYNLSGGTVSAFNLDVRDFNNDDSNYFNFTTGSTGQLTIVSASVFDFESFVDDGRIRLNDNINSDFADFSVSSSVIGINTYTTLNLAAIPEPSTYALLVGVSILGVILVRRRR